MHWLSWEPLCEPKFYVFLCWEWHRGPEWGWLAAEVIPVVWLFSYLFFFCSAGRSGAVAPVLILIFVALWFVLRGGLLCVLPCVILFLCFSDLLALRLPRLGKRELILVLFVRLFDLCLFGFVGFLFLLVFWKGCGLWLWHSLDFSLTFYFFYYFFF